MEKRIWPGSEAAAATGEAGEHFGKAVYLFFFKPPSTAPPAVLYFSFFRIFFVFLIWSAAGTGHVLQLTELFPIYLVWFPTYDLTVVCATEREKQCLIC